MEFEFTEFQKEWKKKVSDFANKEIIPVADKLDREAKFPIEIWNKMKELNLQGIPIPKDYGGVGGDFLTFILAVEELSRASAGVGVSYEIHVSLVTQSIMNFGTEEQKKVYGIPLAKGDHIGVFTLTEPEAGSDVSALKTTATLEGDSYVLNGKKHFIANASVGNTFLVFAYTDKAKGTKGISAFIVPRNTDGLEIGKMFEKMGVRSLPISEVIFENCRIPKENILGKEGEGFIIAMTALDRGRIGIAGQCLGIAQASLDASVEFAKKRVQFGKPIANLQAIQWFIAEMATKLSAARALTYQVAKLADKNIRFSKEAAMAKLFASDMVVEVTRNAVQLHGGYGYISDLPIERYYRDAKVTEIYEGTSEIQKLVIANNLLKG